MAIPKGTTIHTMNVFMNVSSEPSVDDLKSYDLNGHRADITQLKAIANAKPANEYAQKKLTLDDAATWITHNEKIKLMWENMRIEFTQHGVYQGMMFLLPYEWCAENGIASMTYMRRYKRRQNKHHELFNTLACSDMNNDFMLAHIKFERTDDYVFIDELNSELEIIWPTAAELYFKLYETGTVTEMVLTEAMRLWLNDGVKTIDLASAPVMQQQGRKPSRNVYDGIPKRNAFKLQHDTRFWRFQVTQS